MLTAREEGWWKEGRKEATHFTDYEQKRKKLCVLNVVYLGRLRKEGGGRVC